MTAWELITANSTATLGSTAWDHSNSQEGGGSSFPVQEVDAFILDAGISTNMLEVSLQTHIVDSMLTATIMEPILTLEELL